MEGHHMASDTRPVGRNDYWRRLWAHISGRDLLVLGAILLLAAGCALPG
jgi:hypothetical protein